MNTKYIILLLVIIVIARVGYDVIRVRRLISIGKKISAAAIPYQQHPTNASKRILIVGDSTGVGTGSESNQGSVAGRFGQAFPDAEITNRSKNGARMYDVRQVLDSIQEHYDFILIQAGGNDIINFTDTDKFKTDLDSVLIKATRLAPNVIGMHSGNVGLAPLFPFYVKPIFAARTRTIRAIYKELAAKHGVRYIDLYTDKDTDPFNPNYSKFYAPDMLHLSSEGYGVWFDKIKASGPILGE